MSYAATILLDSISERGDRLTTFEITFPRLILAEINTHRAASKNSASSRAIPVGKLIRRVIEHPFIPTYWGKSQKGMRAQEQLSGWRRHTAKLVWVTLSRVAVVGAYLLSKLGVHKQLANRVLEPFLWHTIIISATDWDNFFALRNHPNAQPEMQTIAKMIQDAYDASIPTPLREGEWHLPLLFDRQQLEEAGYTLKTLKQVSAGRCARVSCLTHFGVRDPLADFTLCNDLINDHHMSPVEHVATPCEGRWGNFNGWKQMRQEIPFESNYAERLKNDALSRHRC